jgi:hypothetical protein
MKHSRSLLLLFIPLLLVALACNLPAGGEEATAVVDSPTAETSVTEAPPTEALDVPTDTPAAAPTDTPEVKPTDPPPTSAPEPTQPPEQPTLALETTPYSQPQGLFELFPPQGWIVEDKEAGASFNAPDDSGFINVEVTNTGLILDGDSFERFVNARDANFFGGFEGYEVLNQQIDKGTGVARITKRLLFDGIPQIVMTLYDQHDQSVFSIDFWSDVDLTPIYSEAYEEIINTANVDGALAASETDMYYWIYDFYGPGDLFTIEVPIPWTYERTGAEGDIAIVDTFYSPDEHGIVQNISWDDGTEVSKGEAGAFALELLRTSYAEDIRITDDQVQADGSERLTWHSPGGAYSGISFLETRGTTFLLFTVLWDDPFEDVYFDVLDYTIGTYDVP